MMSFNRLIFLGVLLIASSRITPLQHLFVDLFLTVRSPSSISMSSLIVNIFAPIGTVSIQRSMSKLAPQEAKRLVLFLPRQLEKFEKFEEELFLPPPLLVEDHLQLVVQLVQNHLQLVVQLVEELLQKLTL